MKLLMIPFAALFFLAAPLAFAESWTGYLVDSRCYDAAERSVNPFDAPNASRDKELEIRQCPASAKTKSFAVVGRDQESRFKLDPFGNELAVAFVRKFGKKPLRQVTVTGERHFDTIIVKSISDPN